MGCHALEEGCRRRPDVYALGKLDQRAGGHRHLLSIGAGYTAPADRISDLQPAHPTAQGCDHAGGFSPQDSRKGRGTGLAPGPAVDIGEVDPDGLHPNQGFPFSGRRFRAVLILQYFRGTLFVNAANLHGNSS